MPLFVDHPCLTVGTRCMEISMNATVLMGEGNRVRREDLHLIPMPANTATCALMPWQYFVDTICHRIERAGWSIKEVTLLTSGKNKQTGWVQELFGTIALEHSDTEVEPCFALRTSYNHTYLSSLLAGMRVFVCSNGCFSGDYGVAFKKQRALKGERNDALFIERLETGISLVGRAFDSMRRKRDFLKSVPLSLNHGHALIGIAQGHGVITDTMGNEARRCWNKPIEYQVNGRTEAPFAELNAWSLYNGFTEAAKKTRAGNLLDAHTKIDAYFSDSHIIPAAASVLDDGDSEVIPF